MSEFDSVWLGWKLHYSTMGWLETQQGALGQMVHVKERREQNRLAFERTESGKIMT